MRSAYDVDSEDGDLENEDVDWYAYDDRWRLVAVHRQDFKYQQVKLRERFVYADRGIGAREGGGPGNKLDCPAYAEFDEDFDGIFERRITYVQDRGGNIVAVFDSSREQFDTPADTTPSQYPIRIAYTAFGEPMNVGTAGLGTYEAPGGVYDVLDLDFNNDGVIDASDLVSITDVVESEGPPTCETNGQACDHADFNRDGDVNADDISTFTAALAKQLNNTGPGYSVHSRNIAEYRFLYRGYWYDQHLGIYHVRHRAYDPRIQRWLQPDPAMFVDGLNRYAYCGNRPFSRYDPMGLSRRAADEIVRNPDSPTVTVIPVPLGDAVIDFYVTLLSSVVPVLGEIQDVEVMTGPYSAGERALATASLMINLGTAGLAPNAGGAIRSVRGAADALEAADAVHDIVIAGSKVKSYRELVTQDGFQRAHLNQAAAFSDMKREEMLATYLTGGTHDGLEHAKMHQVLDSFWDKYRDGRLANPTVAEYHNALRDALKATGRYTDEQVDELVRMARDEAAAGGYPADRALDKIPRRCTSKESGS